MAICFFIGHRDTPASIFPMLREAVERHITEDGVSRYGSTKAKESLPNCFMRAKWQRPSLLCMSTTNKNQKGTGAKISKQDMEALSNVASYINDHFNADLPFATLARIACMGTTKLKSSFKQTYRCTISEYIGQRRMSHAEMLLTSTELAIDQIASAIGYSNAGRFDAAFKSNTGFFPAEYRKMAQRK